MSQWERKRDLNRNPMKHSAANCWQNNRIKCGRYDKKKRATMETPTGFIFLRCAFLWFGVLGRKRFANKSQFYQCFIFTASHYLENVFCMCRGSLSPFFSILAHLKMKPFIELDIFTRALATYSFFRLCSIPFDKIQFCFVSSNSEILAQSSQCKIFQEPIHAMKFNMFAYLICWRSHTPRPIA